MKNVSPYARGLLTGLGLIVVGMLLGQTGGLAVPRLNQFFPRAQDLFYEDLILEALEIREILSVPGGKVFVLTYFTGSNSVFVLKNGIFLTNQFLSFCGGGCSVVGKNNYPIQFAFLPGESLSLQNTIDGQLQNQIWGYWAEYSP